MARGHKMPYSDLEFHSDDEARRLSVKVQHEQHALRKSRSTPSQRQSYRRKPSMEFTASLQAQAAAAKVKYNSSLHTTFGLFPIPPRGAIMTDQTSDYSSGKSSRRDSTEVSHDLFLAPNDSSLSRSQSRSRLLVPSYSQYDPYSECVADFNILQRERPINSTANQHAPPPLNVPRRSSVASQRRVRTFSHSDSTLRPRSPVQRLMNGAEARKSKIHFGLASTPPIPRRNSKRLRQTQSQASQAQRYSLGQALGLTIPLSKSLEKYLSKEVYDSNTSTSHHSRDRGSIDLFGTVRIVSPDSSAAFHPSDSPSSTSSSSDPRRKRVTREVHHYHVFQPIVPLIDVKLGPSPTPPSSPSSSSLSSQETLKPISHSLTSTVRRLVEKARPRRYFPLPEPASAALPSPSSPLLQTPPLRKKPSAVSLCSRSSGNGTGVRQRSEREREGACMSLFPSPPFPHSPTMYGHGGIGFGKNDRSNRSSSSTGSYSKARRGIVGGVRRRRSSSGSGSGRFKYNPPPPPASSSSRTTETATWWVQQPSAPSERMDRFLSTVIPAFSFDREDLMPEELQPKAYRSKARGGRACDK